MYHIVSCGLSNLYHFGLECVYITMLFITLPFILYHVITEVNVIVLIIACSDDKPPLIKHNAN